MHQSIDLGRTEEYPGGPIPMPQTDERRYYPEFTYSGDQELDLPKRGKMTIEYCVKREVEEERGDESHYSCTIAVEKILDVEGEKDDRPSKRDMSAEEALDALAKAVSKNHDSDESY